MKALPVSISIAILLLASAPAAPQSKNIHEDTDPYSKLKALYLEVSTHSCHGYPSSGLADPQIHLLFVASENENHTISYFVTTELDRGGYSLGLHPRGTMDVLIDGTVGTLSTTAGSNTVTRHWIDHSYPHESIPFNVSEAELERLSQAQSFQFRINGPHQALQRCTDARRMRDLTEFLGAAKAYGLPEFAFDLRSGSVQFGPITEEINPSDNHKTVTLANIATQACAGDPPLRPGDADVYLSISANQRSDGGVWYFISTEISNGATLGLPRGAKLHTRIGGQTGAFNALSGSVLTSRTDLSGRHIWHETTAFHVHQTDIVALTRAPMLDLSVSTPSGEVHRCASADQFAHLGEFIGIAATY